MVAWDPWATISALMAKPHELQIRVRYAETDQMGVVHHASYLIYMEEGRTALMRQLGFPYEGVEERGFAMAVRKLDVRYRQFARYGDEIRVRTTVERLRGASIVYAYDMERFSDGAPLLTGSAEIVCLDMRNGFQPAPIPDDIRETLERYLA